MEGQRATVLRLRAQEALLRGVAKQKGTKGVHFDTILFFPACTLWISWPGATEP